MVQLTFWTVLALCLSIYRAANEGDSDTDHVDGECCERICTGVIALCLEKKPSPQSFSARYVCETVFGTVPSDKGQAKNVIYSCTDEKHSCDMSCIKPGQLAHCLNITFDDHCDTSTMDGNMCHEEDCRNCLDVICNMSRMSSSTTTQSTVNSSGSSTSRMTEMISKSTTVVNSTTSSNSMTGTKGTEPATAFLSGVVVVSVIGVLVILIIAVLLIVIFCRRYRGGRVSFDDRIRGVDIIEATNGQRNPAYSLVQGISTADDSSHHHQSMNIYSESPTQNPSTTNDDDEDDRILVDNDLYGHQQPEQNFPNQTVLSAKENATDDNQPQRDSAYSLVQSVSTTDASFQPPVDSTPSGQRPSPDGNQDTILVEIDLYGCQQAPKSTYETLLRVNDNDAVDNVQTPSSIYTSLQLESKRSK